MMTDGPMDQMIQYTDGQECRPNGVGDYEMVCPTAGVLEGFVPFMRRAVVRGRCHGCGLSIRSLETTASLPHGDQHH